MHTIRRLFVLQPRNFAARLRSPGAIAFLLVIVIPGGLMLPICYGLYGALRHTLASKVSNRTAGPQDVNGPVPDDEAGR
jgi:hypothetical protein